MTKKSNHKKGGAKPSLPRSAEDILSIGTPSEFTLALERLIKCQGSSDYQSMPMLGKWVTALRELVRANEAEDMAHYLLYSEGRWKEADEFLRLIGAEKSLELLNKAISLFDGGRIPEDMTNRLDELSRIENDTIQSNLLQEVIDNWDSTQEDIPSLAYKYISSHRNELEELIANRTLILENLNSIRSMTDDDVIQKAYENGNDPFEGLRPNLLNCDRLPLLLRLAGDKNCPTRPILIGALYAICGNVGSQILAGKVPPDLNKLQEAIFAASSSPDDILKEWAQRSGDYISDPTPELTLKWMSAAFN